MKSNKEWERFHLTKKGWVDHYTFQYILAGQVERLLTRQYGQMQEVDVKYMKTIWQHNDSQLIEIYQVLYPHPLNKLSDEQYHEILF